MKKKDLAWILELPQDQITIVRLDFDSKQNQIRISTDNENSYYEKEFYGTIDSDRSFTFSLPSFGKLLNSINGRSNFGFLPQGIATLSKEGEIKEILEYPEQIEERRFHSFMFQPVESVPVSVKDWGIHNKFRISLMEYLECNDVLINIDQGIMRLLSMNGSAFCKTEFYSSGFEHIDDQFYTIKPGDLDLLSGFFPDDQYLMFNLHHNDSTADLCIVDESMQNPSKVILRLDKTTPQRAFSKEMLSLISSPETRKEFIDLSKFPIGEYRKANTNNRGCSSKSSAKSTEFSVEMKDDRLRFNLSGKEFSLNSSKFKGFQCMINSYDMAQILAFQPDALSENNTCLNWCRNETMISILK